MCCVVARGGHSSDGQGKGGAAVGRQHTAHSLICSFTMTHECADISWDCHSWLFKHIIGLLYKSCMDIVLVFVNIFFFTYEIYYSKRL